MKYLKEPLTTSQIIDVLKERGLFIEDEEKACRYLEHVSYFRFASYLRPMEIDTKSHKYKTTASFDKACCLYEFDMKLRELLFSAIQQIEISLRSKIINRFSLAYGPMWFINDSLATDKHKYVENLNTIERELQRSKDDYIKDHYKKYDSTTFPPSWKILELSSFGCLTKLYINFGDVYVKKKIARDYDVPQHEILESWMKSVNVIRNICAHHGRIWNRIIPVMPQLPKTLKNKWIVEKPQLSNRLYTSLCCIAYWLNSINPNNSFISDFKTLLRKYPNVDTNAMGFMKDWEREPLFRKDDRGLRTVEF